MDRLRKRFVMFVVPVAVILFASFLMAQGPPNPCLIACRQTYTDSVKACKGNPTCLANARAAAEACIRQGCRLQPR